MIRIYVEQSTGFAHRGAKFRKFPGAAHVFTERTNLPMPTIDTSCTRIVIERDAQQEPRPIQNKPPYLVPSMKEIADIPWNGFNVVSTFAGCGGSSAGYRMAGYRVLFANEFVPSAQKSYSANKAECTILDGRDVRMLTADDVLAAIGMKPGKLDVLDGSPPCQAFSTAGKRARHWGHQKIYEHGARQKNEDLFFEYARLLDGLKPKVFVAENVSGLIKGVAKGYFLDILAALKACGYRVEARLLDAQWLGVPQTRQRLIFIGVRQDLAAGPRFPRPLPYRYSVREALPWLISVAHDTHGLFSMGECIDRTSPAIMAGSGPSHFMVKGVGGIRKPGWGAGKMIPASLPSPTIMADGGSGMNTSQFGIEVETDIGRFAIGKEWDRIGPGGQSDKYFQLVRPDVSKPSPTITASDGTTSAAGVVHPTEKRRFSIAELKRICAFPDDFKLVGSYAEQWERLGNSVPPIMMRAIAETIRDEILANA